jgi:hypothetical protein
VALVHDRPASCPLRFSPLGQQIGHHSRSTTTATLPPRQPSHLKEKPRKNNRSPRRIDPKFAEENNLILCALSVDFVLFAGLRKTLSGEEEKKKRKRRRRRRRRRTQLPCLCVFCLFAGHREAISGERERKGRGWSTTPCFALLRRRRVRQ